MKIKVNILKNIPLCDKLVIENTACYLNFKESENLRTSAHKLFSAEASDRR